LMSASVYSAVMGGIISDSLNDPRARGKSGNRR